jgi:ABC-type Na+ transport system ATPase subunit NatA
MVGGSSGALDPSAEDAVAGLLAVAAGKETVAVSEEAKKPVKKRKAASITRVSQAGLTHSSTSHLNLSHFGRVSRFVSSYRRVMTHRSGHMPLKPPNVCHKKCLR